MPPPSSSFLPLQLRVPIVQWNIAKPLYCTFTTYLERENCGRFDHLRDFFHVRKCSVCVNWWFSSAPVMKCHRRIVHPRIPIRKLFINQRNTNYNQPDAKLHMCRHKNCSQSFTTYHKLLIHKSHTGHKKPRKRKAEES